MRYCGDIEAMDRRRAARAVRGFTLVEMLVVLAIIALMAAVAIPTFSRMGLFSGNETQRAARELYTLLRAAEVYAATYRIDTALAYSFYGPSPDNGSLPRYRAVALMYRHPAPHTLSGPAGPAGFLPGQTMFVPVQEDDIGVFRALPGDSALVPSPDGTYAGQGMQNIPAFFIRSGDQHQIDAHVFKPSGRMDIDDTNPKELYTINVGFTGETDESERLVDPAHPEQGERAIPIELYRSTGRVRIAG
jgi:prepilin-type N-terminal cleavage/methylation domain-containing protein